MNEIARRYMQESIRRIKEVIEMDENGYISKDIYLKRGNELIGIHTYGYPSEATFGDDPTVKPYFAQMEAWINAYTEDYKFIASISRVFGPIEETAEELKAEGFVVVPPPPPSVKPVSDGVAR